MFFLKKMYDMFMQRDCEFVEIDPLVVTFEGSLVAANSVIEIDDNALFRQAELKAIADKSQMKVQERIAYIFDLNYIHMGGNVGIMANGAGLAMATMDAI